MFLKEVFRRLGRLVGRHPLHFLVVPMVASTILSAGMFQVAVKNILSCVLPKNLFKLFSCFPGPDKRALAHGRESATLHILLTYCCNNK